MCNSRLARLLSRFLNLLLIAILVTLSSVPYATHSVYADADRSSEIKVLLEEYSAYLQSGKTENPDYFSNNVVSLIKDRRSYYLKFFDAALNSKLLEISSSYITEKGNIVQQDSTTFTVKVSEEIKFVGKAKTKSVDEYPMIKAAKYAVKLADQRLVKDNKKLVAVKKKLDNYINSTSTAIDQSVKESYEIANIVNHEITFLIGDTGLRIIKDSFSDQANDNRDGTDIVYWEGDQYHRVEPDIKNSPDYVINNTSIEILANNLFIDINNSFSTEFLSTAAATYNRTNAKNYANTWVRNTSYFCEGGSAWRDDTYYNLAQYPQNYNCNDCTNFVSQALVAGGIPTSSTWVPYTYRWGAVDGLRLELAV